jgi:hypothetical protein
MFPSPFDLLDLIEAVTADFSAEGMEWYDAFIYVVFIMTL